MENMLMHSTDDDISFHYEAYRIIGDTAEIDDIIKSEGFINLCALDVKSTLSEETANYVSTGVAEGAECILNALKAALDKLPIEIDDVSNMLIQVWFPKNIPHALYMIDATLRFVDRHTKIDTNVFWGFCFDESLKGHQAKATLIAASI